MIVLDTNIVSELVRPDPDARVRTWVDMQPREILFVTAVSEAESRTGLALLPLSQRRRTLATAIEQMYNLLFAGRILPFDSNAAGAYAAIMASRRVAGRPINPLDCQIAAIARSVGASVATRDVSDFQGCGINIINPWDDE